MKNLQLSKPHFLIVIGAPKSGKTSFADRFGDTFNAPYIEASAFYRQSDTVASTMTTVEYVLKQLLKSQATLIYEPLSGSRAERANVAKLARSHGYEPLIIWVQTDLNIARNRALKRTKANPYPMSEDEFEQELSRFTPPNTSESYVVLSGLHTYASQAKTVLKRLSASKEEQRNQATETRSKKSPERSRGASNRSIRIQ